MREFIVLGTPGENKEKICAYRYWYNRLMGSIKVVVTLQLNLNKYIVIRNIKSN
jgi:hypothetical protein